MGCGKTAGALQILVNYSKKTAQIAEGGVMSQTARAQITVIAALILAIVLMLTILAGRGVDLSCGAKLSGDEIR
jgi:hypothetical protein